MHITMMLLLTPLWNRLSSCGRGNLPQGDSGTVLTVTFFVTLRTVPTVTGVKLPKNAEIKEQLLRYLTDIRPGRNYPRKVRSKRFEPLTNRT